MILFVLVNYQLTIFLLHKSNLFLVKILSKIMSIFENQFGVQMY